MEELDNIEYIKKIDRENMGASIHSLPDDMFALLRKLKDFETWNMGEINKILFAGMGGSAIAGDLVSHWLMDRLDAPIFVVRSPSIPAWVDEKTLGIFISYSGNTKETISAFKEAKDRGSKIVTISSGGLLEELSKKYKIRHIKVKKGMQPRAAIAHLFLSSLIPLYANRIIGKKEMEDIEEAVNTAKKLREEIRIEEPSDKNVAKKIAIKIKGKMPWIYAYDFLIPVARRWVTQINENSKTLAIYFEVPECNHNHVVALAENIKEFKIAPVFLRSEEDEFTQINMDYLEEIYRKNSIEPIEVKAHGESKLAKMFCSLYLGDYVSYYLSLLRNVDPTPVDTIAELKRRLRAQGRV